MHLESKASKTGSGVALVAGPSWITVLLIIIFALIAVSIVFPRFLTFATKARESEAKANLNKIASLQIAYFAKTKNWAGLKKGDKIFEMIGWNPEGHTAYAFYCGDEIIPPSNPYRPHPKPGPEWPYPVSPQVSESGFICMAAGTIDSDDFMDVWMIKQDGIPVHLYDDELDLTLYGKTDFRLWYEKWGVKPIILLVTALLLVISLQKDHNKMNRTRLEAAEPLNQGKKPPPLPLE